MLKLKFCHLILFSLAAGLMACFSASANPVANPKPDHMFLVKQGRATSVIVRQASQKDQAAEDAIQELQHHIQRATGITLPVIDASALDTIPQDQVRILFGKGAITRSLGVDNPALGAESYRILADGKHLIFMGVERRKGSQDPPDSPAITYAVDHFLDRVMGVRWLWPGEVGTHVPVTDTIAFEPMDVTHQPVLQHRRLRMLGLYRRPGLPESPLLMTDEQNAQLIREATAWQIRHQLGTRSQFRFGHAFGGWWDKYHQTHPEILAQPPAGIAQSSAGAKRIKLCVSNPLTAQTIIKEWQAAGSPDNWNVSPNDGSPGFCTCENCQAWDQIPNQDVIAMWKGGQAGLNLTGRYIRFWNVLLEAMRKTNPHITLSSYAYSFYSTPEKGFKFHPGMVLGIVDSYDQKGYDTWQGWHDSHAKLFLRPNWWHTGAMAPVLDLKAQGDYFHYALNHGMLGFDFDSLMGHWATQGPAYYLIGRMSHRPELTTEQVIGEYTDAFGPAKDTIRQYIRYWETFTQEAGYTIVGGGTSDSIVKANAPYESRLKAKGLPTAPLIGGWPSLPLLYTPEVMAKAYALLDQADRQIGEADPYARQRVAFLRDGLRHLELSRDVIALAYPQLRPKGATRADFIRKAQQLQAMRAEMTLRHVIWGEELYTAEVRRKAPTLESRLDIVGNNLDWE